MSQNTGSANTTPIYTLWPRIGSAYLTGGNATLTGTPLPQWVASAGNQGSVISRVEVNAVGTTVSSVVNMFLCDTAGVTGMLWRQYPIGIVSASVTSVAFNTADAGFSTPGNPFVLPSGCTVRAALATAGLSAYVKCYLGDY